MFRRLPIRNIVLWSVTKVLYYVKKYGEKLKFLDILLILAKKQYIISILAYMKKDKY